MTSDTIERSAPAEGGDAEVRQQLQLDRKRKRRRWPWVLLGLVVLVAIAVAVRRTRRPAGPRYDTAVASKGDLKETVIATGSLAAKETVDVGAEVSGRVVEVLVDFNDPVTKGQVLLEIDREQLKARVDEAKAQLLAAQASVRTAQVNAKEAKLAADRTKRLFAKGVASEQQVETTRAAAARAHAQVTSAAAQATVARAALDSAKSNLDRATIRSPIDGIVLARNVEAGQTLASNFQVPVLFQLAHDLREMELKVSVDEADVGRVKEGQRATFTVDAYPGRTFESKLVALRNVPVLEQSVVTYDAILQVDNGERLLRPGMTATATVVTRELKDVLLVPNAALRFTPPDKLEQIEREKRQGRSSRREATEEAIPEGPRVWTLDGGATKPVPVEAGATDGAQTAITGGELAPGTELIVDLLPEPR